MLRLRLLSLLALVALPADLAFGQGGRIELPSQRRPEQPDPSEQQEPEAGTESDLQNPYPDFWADAKTPTELLFRDFEMESDTSDKTRNQYLDDLRALGLGTEGVAVHALGSPYPPTVRLAAELLEWVGSPEQDGQDVVRELVVAASRVPSVDAVAACLETARRLNEGVLPAMAVKLLGHPRRQVRTVGEARIARDPHADHIPSLVQFLRFGRDQDVRLRAARLLSVHVERPEVQKALRDTLSSDETQVIYVALDALAGDGQPTAVGYLRDEAGQAPTLIESAYLMFTVLRLQNDSEESLFDEGQVRLMRRMCDDPDHFISGVGAACMAEFLFRSNYAEEMERWNPLLPALLVRSVAGSEFYPQYARFMPVAETSLRRVTGEDLDGIARETWPTWYEENKDGFQLVRGSLHIVEGDRSSVRVTWMRPGLGERVALGPDAEWAPGAHVLGPIGLETVMAALGEAGVLDSSVLPGVYGPEADEVGARVEIVVAGRRKMLTFRGAAVQPWVDDLFAALDSSWMSTNWQELLTGETDGVAAIVARLAAFEDLEGSGRAAAYVDVTTGRVAALDDAELAAWCTEIAAVPGLADSWTPELTEEFLGVAATRASRDRALASQLVEMALVRSGANQVDVVAEAFGDLTEPTRSELLILGLKTLGLEACGVAISDERTEVRVASARALGQLGVEAHPDLRIALDDSHALVVRAALRSVGEIADPAVVDAVLPWAGIGMPVDLQREALWALGRMGDPSSVEVLERAATDGNDAAVRIAALDGLAILDDRSAQDALGRMFPLFVGGPLESSWARAAAGHGGRAARRMMEGYLLDPKPLVARRAAVLGGGLGMPSAAPSLMELMNATPRDTALLEALAMSVGVDFRSMPDPAGTYRAWWEQYGELGGAGWLRKAAEDAAFVLPEDFQDPSKVKTVDSVTALLDILQRGPQTVRGLAAYYLQTLTGVDAQPILIGTPPRELRRRAEPWRTWLEAKLQG